MVAHVVLYQLRPDLSDAERTRVNAALVAAFSTIPTIRRYRVGRRLSIGTGYEAAIPARFDFFGVLEFDDEDGLRAYLEHPAHAELGALFWSCGERTLVFDYALAEGDLATAIAGWA